MRRSAHTRWERGGCLEWRPNLHPGLGPVPEAGAALRGGEQTTDGPDSVSPRAGRREGGAHGRAAGAEGARGRWGGAGSPGKSVQRRWGEGPGGGGRSHPSGVREGSRRRAASWPRTIARVPRTERPLTGQARASRRAGAGGGAARPADVTKGGAGQGETDAQPGWGQGAGSSLGA